MCMFVRVCVQARCHPNDKGCHADLGSDKVHARPVPGPCTCVDEINGDARVHFWTKFLGRDGSGVGAGWQTSSN
eukprot:9911468-Alexandrium_andersonii.AAC.1